MYLNRILNDVDRDVVGGVLYSLNEILFKGTRVTY